MQIGAFMRFLHDSFVENSFLVKDSKDLLCKIEDENETDKNW